MGIQSQNLVGNLREMYDQTGGLGPRLETVLRSAAMIGLVFFFAPLAVFAVTGFSTRLVADDYCFSSVLNNFDFLTAQRAFYLTTSDRYTVMFFVALSEYFGPDAIRLLPALNLAVMLVGLSVLAARIFPARARLAILLAAAALFLTVLAAPDRFQAFYWRSGLFTYSFPLGLLALGQGLILGRLKEKRLSPSAPWIIAFLAWIAGGASETFVALQIALLGLELLAALVVLRHADRRQAVTLLLAGLIASLLALVVMILSPAVGLRQQNLPEPPDVQTIVLLSLRYGFDFLVDSFRTVPLPHLVGLALGGLAGFVSFGEILERRSRLIGLALLPVLTYIMMVAMVSPSVYAESAYPEPRALIVGRFALILAVMGWGILAGAEAGSWLARKPKVYSAAAVAAIAALVLIGLYPLRAAWQALPELRESERWAAAWDDRDAQIWAAIEAGEQDVVVTEFDSRGSLMEIGPDPLGWVNQCAAGTYEIHSIRGVQ